MWSDVLGIPVESRMYHVPVKWLKNSITLFFFLKEFFPLPFMAIKRKVRE